ncbi:MAG: hypothetical protein HeimC3_46420 [Candidatus Heimdallarchaeota archaeon LC_3]|nr:MAG: hypothetical protein HeimC3_46420 [Candidatus Heimdallarchaeota archaeon LC_3]
MLYGENNVGDEFMSEEQWHKHLLESANPFTNIIVRSAWEDFPDVESINGSCTQQVLSFLNDIKENTISRVMLVGGQPGIGKTHFISRLRRISDKNNYLFVAIRPISDVTAIFNHIYREIFTSLRKKKEDQKYSPMKVLISSIISQSLIKALKKKGQSEPLSKKIESLMEKLKKDHTIILSLIGHDNNAMEILQSLSNIAIEMVEEEYPEVDLTFLKVLFKALHPKLHSYALRWLQGDDLDDDILKKLKVKDSISNDDIAQRVLHSLLTLSDKPMLLCFDQLESIYDRFHDISIVVGFFDTIVRLCNETPNALILLMTQTVTWAEQMEPNIQKSAKDRIEHIDTLSVPSNEEMKELISQRLNHVWGTFPYQPLYETYPFSEEYIKFISQSQGWNPRGVLRELSREFQYMLKNKEVKEFKVSQEQISAPKIETKVVLPTKDRLDLYLENQIHKVITQYKENIDDNPYSTRENYLEAGLFDLLKGCVDSELTINNKKVTELVFKKKSKDLDMIATIINESGQEEKWGIEVCNNERGQSFYGILNRITNNLAQKIITKWFIIRDKNLEIKKSWKKSNELLEGIKSSGHLIYIDIDDNARIFGLKEILDLSSSGDLDIEGHPVVRKEVLPYIMDNLFFKVDIINKMFELESKKEGPIITVSKRPKKDITTSIREDILSKANSQMLVNFQKLFPDYKKEKKLYNSVVESLKIEGKIVIMNQSKTNIVIAKSPSDDVF